MDIQTIINDLDIVIEAIKNDNKRDAIKMKLVPSARS